MSPPRRLLGADAAPYRDIRLQALRDHPDSFAASFEDEAAKPLEWFADRLGAGLVFGCDDADRVLLGTAGLSIPAGIKVRHRGLLVGMYVRPAARGAGLGRILLDAVLAFAREHVEEVTLGVTASNAGAIRLYAHAGFVAYGRSARALKIGDRYHDEVLMIWRP